MFWKKLKPEFKEFFDGLLIAFAIGIVTDSTLFAFKVDIPFYFSWGFYSSHSTGFFMKLKSAKKVGLYKLKYKIQSF